MAFLPLILLAGFVASAGAQEADDTYLRIYSILTQAEKLESEDKADAAIAKYREAYDALTDFKKRYPTWNTKIVNNRLNSVVEAVTKLSQPAPKESPVQKPAEPLTVLDAGAEPRHVLRFHPVEGEVQSLSVTMLIGLDVGMPGAEMLKIPPIKMALSTVPKSVSSNEIAFETVIQDMQVVEEPGVSNVMAQAIKMSLGEVKDERISSVISDRGVAKKTGSVPKPNSASAIPGFSDQFTGLFSSSDLMLPEEPVGAGARWQTKRKIKSQGMTMDQTSTYTLVAVDGDILTLKTEQVQKAGSQRIEYPMMPQAKVDLKSATGIATGDLKVDLSKLMPIQGTMSQRNEMEMSMTAGAQRSALNMKTSVRMEFQSR